jgi:hypothetical protein
VISYVRWGVGDEKRSAETDGSDLDVELMLRIIDRVRACNCYRWWSGVKKN